MLAHQLPALPPFESCWDELLNLFAWLEGKLVPKELPSIPLPEDVELEWLPPPTAWVWGQSVPLESVRFAGTNHLCVELGYQGSVRIIEPYSLRRTKTGHFLLYAVKAQTGELRSYRVDRIQSINVTNQPFNPRVAVEFTTLGALTAPPTQRMPSTGLTTRSRRRRSVSSGTVYIIECSYCGKQFKRSKYNTHLRPHKEPDGLYDCSGRTEYEVDRYYN